MRDSPDTISELGSVMNVQRMECIENALYTLPSGTQWADPMSSLRECLSKRPAPTTFIGTSTTADEIDGCTGKGLTLLPAVMSQWHYQLILRYLPPKILNFNIFGGRRSDELERREKNLLDMAGLFGSEPWKSPSLHRRLCPLHMGARHMKPLVIAQSCAL